VTLREAEAETGIPVNTLRKWIRKADLPSYLEADGDLALRMVDLDAVVARARELGRDLVPPSGGTGEPASQGRPGPDLVPPSGGTGEPASQGGVRAGEPEDPPTGTMIVPVDAWNKMLNQLGNLHEAGQQLAEARERAAKAETESKFLRQQLADTRDQKTEDPGREPDIEDQASGSEPEASIPTTGSAAGASVPTTAYWRYLTSGWRERKKRRG
jgi:hypothetical protein